MRLKAENFGPLRKLDIEVKPLTILIGKNSLGKSYAAQLLYTLLCVLNDFRRSRQLLPYILFDNSREMRRIYPRDSEIVRLTGEIRSGNLDDLSIVQKLAKLILDVESQNLKRLLEAWLGRVYGVDVYKLVNITSSKAKIQCDIFNDLSFEVEITKHRQMKVELTLSEDKARSYLSELAPTLQKIRQKRKKKTYVEELMRLLQNKLMMSTTDLVKSPYSPWSRRYPAITYYIPAGRAGLIESYDTVVEALFFHAAGTPSSGLSVSPLPGMANQFYGVLRSLNGEKGPLSKEITPRFLQLLNGNITLSGVKLRKNLRAVRMRMIYHFSLNEKSSWIELTHAASMIKELAPIYLIVQELVTPGQYLIVEEPESHLHPGAQFGLAEVFAKLASHRVNVLLTTHSAVMLRKLSHFIRKTADATTENVDYSCARIYWLKEGKRGSTSMPIKISKHGTLDQIPTFDEVINELYEEEVSLNKGEK